MLQIAQFLLNNVLPEARQWPCFVAPTGAGKSARAQQIAERLNLPLVVLLPGTALPEDILGLPQVSRGKTIWTLPDWAAQAAHEPTLVFIDELDKARPETHGALLTLMSALAVRNVALHPQTRIICAMQPVDKAEWLSTETGRALSARLCFLPLGYDRERHAKAWRLSAASLDALFGAAEAPVLPTLPVISDRQVTALTHYLRQAPDEATAKAVVEGIAGVERAQAILHAWREAATLTPQALVATIVEDPALAADLSVQEAVHLAPVALIEGTPQAFVAILRRVATAGTLEDWQTAIGSLHPAVTAASGGGQEVTIFRADPSAEDATFDSLAQELIALAQELPEE